MRLYWVWGVNSCRRGCTISAPNLPDDLLPCCQQARFFFYTTRIHSARTGSRLGNGLVGETQRVIPRRRRWRAWRCVLAPGEGLGTRHRPLAGWRLPRRRGAPFFKAELANPGRPDKLAARARWRPRCCRGARRDSSGTRLSV